MQTNKQISGDAAVDELNKGGGAGGMPTNQMGAEGGLSNKAPGKPMNKSNGEVDEEEEEDETKKSMVHEEDLLKSMDVLQAAAEGTGDPDRRAELAQRAAEGTLSKSERAEFIQLLGGAPEPDEEPLRRSFVDDFTDDEELQKGFEVSPFLEQLGVKMADGLDDLRKSIEQTEEINSSFRGALAKSLKATAQVITNQGSLIKSMAMKIGVLENRVEHVEQTPMPRRAVSSAAAAAQLKKGGMQEGEGPYEGYTRDQLLEGMNTIMEKSMQSGDKDLMMGCGVPLPEAIAKLETTGAIARPVLEEVKRVINQ